MTKSSLSRISAVSQYLLKLVLNVIKLVQLVIFSVISAILLYPLLIIFYTPILIYRQIVKCIAQSADPKCGPVVEGTNAFLASPNPYENIPMVLAPYFLFNSKVERSQIVKVVKEQIIEPNVFPELKQRIVRKYGYFFRYSVEDFNVEDHVRYLNPDCPDDIVKRTDFRRMFMEKIGNPPFEPSRSPWELIVITNFVDENNPSLKSCVVLRTSHSLMDGYSMVSFIQKAAKNPWKIEIGQPANQQTSRFRATLKAILQLLEVVATGPYHAINMCYLFNDNSDFLKRALAVNSEHDDVKGIRERESLKIDGERLKKVRNILNVRMSSLLVSMLSEGVMKYMRLQCINNSFGELPSNFFLQMSFPLPDHPHTMTNHWTTVGIPIKVYKKSDPLKTLTRINKYYEYLKTSVVPLIPHIISKLIGVLPLCLIPNFASLPKQTLIMGSMPGPPRSVDMFGYLWEDFGFLGTSTSKSAFFASIQNMSGKFWIDVGVPGTLFRTQDDLNTLEKCVHDVLDELETIAASKTQNGN